jgi:hypothetical protein
MSFEACFPKKFKVIRGGFVDLGKCFAEPVYGTSLWGLHCPQLGSVKMVDDLVSKFNGALLNGVYHRYCSGDRFA